MFLSLELYYCKCNIKLSTIIIINFYQVLLKSSRTRMNAKQISYLSTNYVLAAFIGLGYPSCHVESYKISFFANDRKKLLSICFHYLNFYVYVKIKKKCKRLLGHSIFMFALRCFLLVIFFIVRAFGHYYQTSQSTISTTKSATSTLTSNSSAAVTTSTPQSSSLSSTTPVRTTHTSPRSKCFF